MTTTRFPVADGARIQIRCDDCRNFVFADEGGTIRHAKKCDYRHDRTFFAPESGSADAPDTASTGLAAKNWWEQERLIRRAARNGEISAVLSDDDIVDAVRVGAVSVSDAMNRDF